MLQSPLLLVEMASLVWICSPLAPMGKQVVLAVAATLDEVFNVLINARPVNGEASPRLGAQCAA